SLDERRVAAAVEEVVRVVGPEVRTEQAIRDALAGDRRIVGLAIRQAHKEDRLVREGSGRRGDPFRYYRRDEEEAREREESARKREKRESQKRSDRDSGDSRCARFPASPLTEEPDEEVEWRS